MYSIKSIELRNWLRYRGTHRLVLQQESYGVTCKWEHDDDRSNYGGKSSWIEAPRFALYGKHRKRKEDEWITHGEDEGGVLLHLVDADDSVFVERSRKRGESTRLVIRAKHHAKGSLLKDEAQEFIEKHVTGLSLEDFDSSCYFAQKKMSQFVTGISGDRMDVVTGWLRLERLEEAAEAVGDELSAELSLIAGIEQQKQACLDLIKQVHEPLGIAADAHEMITMLGERVTDLDEKIAQARKTEQLFLDQSRAEFEAKGVFKDAAEYHRVVDEGKALRKKMEAYAGDLITDEQHAENKKQNEELAADLGVARHEVELRQLVSKGDFDGCCPLADLQCPAKDRINTDRLGAKRALKKAEKAATDAERRYLELMGGMGEAERFRRRHAEDSAKIEFLLKDARRLKPAADRAAELREPDEEVSTTDEDLLKAHQHLASLVGERAQAIAGRDLVKKQLEIFQRADADLAKMRSRTELLREAHHILGKGGAQRQIAMAAFGQIERGANLALSKCGIDLTAKVSWERETGELAKTCVDCGTAFPKSRREKQCSLCGAQRGVHFERRFEVAASDQSGAADDLVGIAVQLAAAEWLRRDRQSGWAVAFLDEPLAHLDRAHARALMGHLPALLKRFGFTQSFICAHDVRAMAGMPATIEIVAGPNGSRVGEEIEHGTGEVGGRGEGAHRRDAAGARGGEVDDRAAAPPPRRRLRRAPTADGGADVHPVGQDQQSQRQVARDRDRAGGRKGRRARAGEDPA